jgi:uncharacterized protein
MQDERLGPEIRIGQFGQDQESSYFLTPKTEWVGELLNELQESLEQDEVPTDSSLKVDLTLANKESTTLNEHFVIKGRFYGTFHTACIRCLIPTPQSVDSQFACCFLPDHLEKAAEYEEVNEVYCDEQNMELYFTEPKGRIDLKELVHEQLFMTIEPLPIHAEDCKGLCMTCGTNLNTDSCKHSK